MPTLTAYLAHAPIDVVLPLVQGVFTDAGWRLSTTSTPDATQLTAERGSRTKTFLLAGAAGEDFHLRQELTLTSQAEATSDLSLLGSAASSSTATRIDYPTAGARAINCGGVYGADQEMRAHDDLAEQIVTALRQAGIDVGHL
ncbi:Uncharacterised protein [Actinomyces bovis]|uniref:Uncharacterized protein n=1 Tax=Actinomyces bovis TaxID=1658 RepID=A0ABY1VNL3_9ACTO|nr:hypothetical protein [Actinomyces bovis]SPT53700.1 Uncharacterised protein [Actinomyces bovis]VEG55830.1 Uncharacterised protein [Actinomyces israelii]